MQYGQRKLHLSITEMRRSCSGRFNVSRGRGCDAAESRKRDTGSGTMEGVSDISGALYHHEYNATGAPAASAAGPAGSSTKPSVPISEVKSPDPRVGLST